MLKLPANWKLVFQLPKTLYFIETNIENDQDIATIKYLGITYMQGRGVASIEVLDV